MSEWHRDGNLLYTLQHAGWHRGQESFKNHLTVRVEVHQGDAADADALADRLHRFLSAPASSSPGAWTEEELTVATLAMRTALLEHYPRENLPFLEDLGEALKAALSSLNATPPAIGHNITFSPFDPESGNAVVSPDTPADGAYWTLIAQGGESQQNAIAAEICRRLNAPAPLTSEEVEAVRAALIEKFTLAACDPGRFVGYKKDRSLGQWMHDAIAAVLTPDAVLALLSSPPAAEEQKTHD